MKHTFNAKIYKTGINWCVDVPINITENMLADKGYITIKGQINDFDFTKTLVPVKNAPYRLFVNLKMMKGAKTELGKEATFEIEQDTEKKINEYPIPILLVKILQENNLTTAFENLTASRKKDILKYLSYVKTNETLIKNVEKLISQLKNKEKNVRLP
jgi:Bacteriocin-protection, YdeI or OmpD-Associated/Domain of unknown function (DUF1905)